MNFKNLFLNLASILANLKKLLSLIWEMDKILTIGYYLTALIGALIPLAATVTLSILIDRLIETGTSSTIPIIVVTVLSTRYILILTESIVLWGVNRIYFDYLLRYKATSTISNKFYEKLSSLDIAHLENPEIQNLISKVRDSMTWRPLNFLSQFSYMFGSIAGYCVAFVVLWQFGWWISVVITITSLPRLYLRAKYGTIQWAIDSSGAPEAKKLWYLRWLLSTDTTIREMKIFQSSRTLLDKLTQIQNYLFKLNKKSLDNYLKQISISPIFEVAVLFTVAFLTLPDVLSAVITIGSFTLLINMIDQINNHVAFVVNNFGEMHEHNLYVNDYFKILSLQKIITEIENPVIVKNAPPKIEFQNVSFKYPDGPLVLKNISFIINPGESVALVGVNGAGKSTIIKLLCRFYDVTEGKILINGIDIKNVQLASWYQCMGTLFQDFVHYYLTVKDNILLGNPDKYDEKLMKEAAEKSGANDFIEKLPKGYDQTLGREYDGEELSIGQWQKLAIARAFYQSPPLLILDEPTSAIDAEAEFEIFNNLEKTYKNKSLILVSHRFSTVRNAGKIFVIENGEITERGNHKELIKLRGKYAKMFQTQAQGYK